MKRKASRKQEIARKQQRCKPVTDVKKLGNNKTEVLPATKTPRSNRISKQENKSTFLLGQTRKDDLTDKYIPLCSLGEGGHGSVFAGIRITDKLPVAIKHIPKSSVRMRSLTVNGSRYKIPLEVVLMQKAGGEPELVGQSSAVCILEWYDLEHEIVLVMERPVPSVDLWQYINHKGPMDEDMAKLIMKQLIEAAIRIDSAGVFHRDIKTENILIEEHSDGPRVRVIDFGCGSILSRRNYGYRIYVGTPQYVPPEFFVDWSYKAGPTTVWQLTAVLYEMLEGFSHFDTVRFICKVYRISSRLSQDCQDFMKMGLALLPEKRATLKQMQQHSWLTNPASTITQPLPAPGPPPTSHLLFSP
ncbi:serine/threonine-protein kinase pim-1-like [Solea solea]|uniref:serine/threonine-protein kinase pim-1-like n=1 Tax=Solea solea TaxID=90069 RepID=UPI00272D1903|nr:serine/threonine-protein kinase pim-1-like [Solea solea]